MAKKVPMKRKHRHKRVLSTKRPPRGKKAIAAAEEAKKVKAAMQKK